MSCYTVTSRQMIHVDSVKCLVISRNNIGDSFDYCMSSCMDRVKRMSSLRCSKEHDCKKMDKSLISPNKGMTLVSCIGKEGQLTQKCNKSNSDDSSMERRSIIKHAMQEN